MEQLFLRLLNQSIAAGWLILAVFVLRLLLKKAPRWTSCMLWGIVAVRLICPFTLKSIFSLIPSGETLSLRTVMYAQEPELDSGISFLDRTLNPAVREYFAPAPGASVNPLHVWMYLGGVLWAAGMILLLLYAFGSVLYLRRKLQESVLLEKNIRICDAVESPFILGVIWPQIYLPSDLQVETRAYVLAHERAHLARLDHWWKLLGYLLLAVYWFHPLMWAAYLLFCRDIELACDEKVVRTLKLNEKKAYSHALVTCSTEKRMLPACPLAFGEVGVTGRVKAVLNYRKPAFWAVPAAILICIIASVCFLTDPKQDSFQVKIVIPAGGESGFWYSDEEISPLGNTITLWSGQGLEDTEAVLLPLESEKEEDYSPVYLTRAMPVKMKAEKGAWFKIGVHMENPTEEDKIVYVRADGAEIRISCPAETDAGDISPFIEDLSEPASENTERRTTVRDTEQSSLDAAIWREILAHNEVTSSGEEYNFVCCDFFPLGSGTDGSSIEDTQVQTVTQYGWALYQAYRISEDGIEEAAGSHLPTALTFEMHVRNGHEPEYELKEYWTPGEGSYFLPDVRGKFPAEIAGEAIDSQKFILTQMQSCYSQAVLSGQFDVNAVVGRLLQQICESPGASSNPQDYIEEHDWEYRELIFYGRYTLRYCFEHFDEGEETGLKGRIMALLCEEILQNRGKLPEEAGTAQTGQLWYDTFRAHAGNVYTAVMTGQSLDL